MKWLSNIFSGGVSEAVGAIGGAAKDLEDVFTTSDREKLEQYEAETDRIAVTQRERLGQMGVNREEARHRSIWVAGWRPAIGWVCAFSIAWNYVLADMIRWALAIVGKAEIALPQLTGTAELMSLVLGMLGLGGLRSWEKHKGLTR